MKLNLFLLVCLAAAAVVSANVRLTSSPVPMFVWSDKAYFANAAQVNEVVGLGEVSQLLKKAVSSQGVRQTGVLRDYVGTYPQTYVPEVMVAFLQSKMSGSDMSRSADAYGTSGVNGLSSLQATMERSRSALVMPYVAHGDASVPQALIDLVKNADASAQTHTALAADGCDAVLSKLDESSSMYYDGKTDLFLVKANDDDTAGSSACMQRVMERVSQQTFGNYVGLYSAEAAQSVNVDFSTPEARDDVASFAATNPRRGLAQGLRAPSFLETQAAASASGSTTPTDLVVGPQYLLPAILSGLCLAGMLLFILWLGVSCLMAVERPIRFSKRSLVIAKEA